MIPNFYNNFWNIGNLNVAYFEAADDISEFEGYDPYPNMLIVGRMNESKMNGVLSYAGLPGLNYDKNSVPDSIIKQMDQEQPRYIILYNNIIPEYRNFMSDKKSPSDYCAYLSQTGGQGMVFSLINNILPFQNSVNYKIIKLFNAILVSLSFVLFLGWCYRNFGILASFITLVFIVLSPWITLLGSGLWWAIWALYIPFLGSLLIFEKKNKQPDQYPFKYILIVTFAAVFAKCFFTGYEFITSSLMAIYTPAAYYSWLNKENILRFIRLCFYMGISAVCAVVTSLLILIYQIQHVMGGYAASIEYIKHSVERRTHFQTGNIPDNIFEIVFKRYLKEDAFFFGFTNHSSPISYILLICIIFILCAFLVFLCKKLKKNRKYSALAITTLFSFSCPVSWYYFFTQHSHQHPFYDQLVWYIVFLLWGYLTIAVNISLFANYLKKKIINKSA